MKKGITVHELKTWPQYWEALESGVKTFEVRKLDRLFGVGDTLHLREWSPTAGYSGREMKKTITYLMAGGQWGLSEGNCILGIKSLLTQPADVQERAKELAVDFAWENVLNHADGYQSFIKAFDTWFSGNKYHQNKFAGASSGMQWVKVLSRLKLIVRDLETERDSDKEERNKWYVEGLKKAVIIVKCHISDMEKFPIESSPSSMQEENERLRLILQECKEYFDDKADVDLVAGLFSTNKEAKLLSTITEALNKQ